MSKLTMSYYRRGITSLVPLPPESMISPLVLADPEFQPLCYLCQINKYPFVAKWREWQIHEIVLEGLAQTITRVLTAFPYSPVCL